VKVPQKWIFDLQLAKQIIMGADDYLRQSNHIVSIKFYAPVTVVREIATSRYHAFSEVPNPKFPELSGEMFRPDLQTPGDMPSWWIRIAPELRLPK
jgi:hypothetical protein